VLANRESARQTILRRQAIRDELARKVADLSSQNESMKKVGTTAPCSAAAASGVMSSSRTPLFRSSCTDEPTATVQEKDVVMEEYLSLKEANKQLKEEAHRFPTFHARSILE
jgi:hypothetical protein